MMGEKLLAAHHFYFFNLSTLNDKTIENILNTIISIASNLSMMPSGILPCQASKRARRHVQGERLTKDALRATTNTM